MRKVTTIAALVAAYILVLLAAVPIFVLFVNYVGWWAERIAP